MFRPGSCLARNIFNAINVFAVGANVGLFTVFFYPMSKYAFGTQLIAFIIAEHSVLLLQATVQILIPEHPADVVPKSESGEPPIRGTLASRGFSRGGNGHSTCSRLLPKPDDLTRAVANGFAVTVLVNPPAIPSRGSLGVHRLLQQSREELSSAQGGRAQRAYLPGPHRPPLDPGWMLGQRHVNFVLVVQ